MEDTYDAGRIKTDIRLSSKPSQMKSKLKIKVQQIRIQAENFANNHKNNDNLNP